MTALTRSVPVRLRVIAGSSMMETRADHAQHFIFWRPKEDAKTSLLRKKIQLMKKKQADAAARRDSTAALDSSNSGSTEAEQQGSEARQQAEGAPKLPLCAAVPMSGWQVSNRPMGRHRLYSLYIGYSWLRCWYIAYI